MGWTPRSNPPVGFIHTSRPPSNGDRWAAACARSPSRMRITGSANPTRRRRHGPCRRVATGVVSAPAQPAVPLSSPAGRWLIVAAALGSGVAFLDGSVVNVALPAIGHELGGGFSVLQWVLDGYLLTLSALLL